MRFPGDEAGGDKICLWRFLSLRGERWRTAGTPISSTLLDPLILPLSLSPSSLVCSHSLWSVLTICLDGLFRVLFQLPSPSLLWTHKSCPLHHPPSGQWGWPDALSSKHLDISEPIGWAYTTPKARSLKCSSCFEGLYVCLSNLYSAWVVFLRVQ